MANDEDGLLDLDSPESGKKQSVEEEANGGEATHQRDDEQQHEVELPPPLRVFLLERHA